MDQPVPPGTRTGRVGAAVAAAIALVVASLMLLSAGPALAATSVPLGTAASFAVLAGSRVTNTGPTQVSGDLGVSPGSAVTGFPPGLVSGGTQHAADAVALQAQSDLTIAYNNAAGQPRVGETATELGGQTFVAGVYGNAGELGLTGTVTLDAQGDSDAVFIFQAGSTLITASNSTVALVNGADACNVFWQVGSSATLGTGTVFRGTVLALTSITANTGATVQGRLLARNGAVTLDNNVIDRTSCAATPAPEPTTTTTAPPTTTTTAPPTTTTAPTTTTTTAPPATTTAPPTSTTAPTTTTTAPTTTTTAPTTTTTAPTTTTTTAPTTAPPTTTTTTPGNPGNPGVPGNPGTPGDSEAPGDGDDNGDDDSDAGGDDDSDGADSDDSDSDGSGSVDTVDSSSDSDSGDRDSGDRDSGDRDSGDRDSGDSSAPAAGSGVTGGGSGGGAVVPRGYPATGAGGSSAPDLAWVLAGGLVLLGSAAVALQLHRRRNAR